jgi:hypothetical protein
MIVKIHVYVMKEKSFLFENFPTIKVRTRSIFAPRRTRTDSSAGVLPFL